jgi:hypothetical protein
MAVTMSLYDHSVKLLVNKEVTLTTLKVKLLDATATFSASDTTVTAVDSAGTKEVSGNGWTTGGLTLASVVVTQVTTNDAMLDANDATATATGGTIGPAFAALVYDSTSNKPLVYIDFGQAQSAGNTTDFKIVWDANGLIKFSYS